MDDSGLTRLQTRFIAKLMEPGVSGTAAYKHCKPRASVNTCATEASKLLRNPKVKAELARLQQKCEDEMLVTVREIVTGILEVKDRCMQKSPVMEGTGKDRRQKEELVIDPDTGEMQMRQVWEFKEAGALKAWELLGKWKKMFSDVQLNLNISQGVGERLAKALKAAGQ